MNLNMRILAILFIFSLTAVLSVSAQNEQVVELKPTKLFPKAGGQAVITDKGNQKQITISAKGLQPGGVYSALLSRVQEPQMAQALGEGDVNFRADRNGNVKYQALADAGEFHNWTSIDIIYHKNGEIRDTGESSFIVLKGLLDQR
jgi:hypothetical protein